MKLIQELVFNYILMMIVGYMFTKKLNKITIGLIKVLQNMELKLMN
jgi:hypothetical protein